MTRRLALIALLLVLAAEQPADAAEPAGFHGVQWGDDQIRVRAQPGWRYCEELSADKFQRARGDARCVVTVFPDAFGGVQAEAHYFLGHRDGVRWVLVKFPAKDFTKVRILFVERYGEPTYPAPYPQNAGPFDVLLWRGASTRVVLIADGPSVQSTALVGLRAEVEAELDRIAKEKTKILSPQ